MKMLMLLFHRESERKIMDYLGTGMLESYSLIPNIYDSGLKSVTDAWAADGEMLLITVSEQMMPALKKRIQGLKDTYNAESIRAFILPVDEEI